MEPYRTGLPLFLFIITCFFFFICCPPRIYQDAQVVHTQQFKPVQTKGNLGEVTRNLLDLSPDNVVFYVGGYPDDFTVNAFFSPSVNGFCVMISLILGSFWIPVYLLSPFVFAFFSHQTHSTMANTLAALSSPPLMTNSSVYTTLRMRLISTKKPLARGKLSTCEWFDAYVLILNNILTITPIMHFIKLKEKNLLLFLFAQTKHAVRFRILSRHWLCQSPDWKIPQQSSV